MVLLIKNPPANTRDVRDMGLILGLGMATHSSILAWRIPWTEEPGRLQSWGRKELDTTERLSTYRSEGHSFISCEDRVISHWHQCAAFCVSTYPLMDTWALSPSGFHELCYPKCFEHLLVFNCLGIYISDIHYSQKMPKAFEAQCDDRGLCDE